MFLFSDADLTGPASFVALPVVTDSILANTTDCIFKKCCKKYKKGKRCKNCPDK